MARFLVPSGGSPIIWTGKKQDVIQFGLDAGFREENSLGFGFMVG